MNARDLVELAVVAVSHADTLLKADMPLATSAVEAYWTAAKCRQQRWHAAFKLYHEQAQKDRMTAVRAAWQAIRPVIDEVLGSEVLSRVAAALLCQRDAARGEPEAGPIARSVLLGHHEARHRALNVLVYGRGSSIAESVDLNRLRRRYEQWSDLLLAALHTRCEVDEFAVETARVQRFASELDYQGGDITVSPAWQWIRATLRSSFLDHIVTRSPNEDLNERLADSVLELLGAPRESLRTTVHSPWLERLCRPGRDVRGNVQQVLFGAQERRRPVQRFDAAHPLRPRPRF